MTPEKQRIAIAEACGYKRCVNQDGIGYAAEVWCKPGLPTVPYPNKLPDYTSDLNAMHEAEKKFGTLIEKQAYFENILFTVNPDPKGDGSAQEYWDVCHATAAQRAEAFLRTIGKWEDAS